MILLVCVDDRYGMCFNRRRQSSDKALTDKILEMTFGKRLWMNDYSSRLFPVDAAICVDDDFLEKASAGEYCFVENSDIEPYLGRAERIILFFWNRRYPADRYFPKEVLGNQWKLLETFDFYGNSHAKITMEVYGI